MERSPYKVYYIKGLRERVERVCAWILGGFSKIGDYPGQGLIPNEVIHAK
jgi:hypothetical protein